MQSVPIVLGHGVDVGAVAAEEVDDVIMPFVAGEVDGTPII